MSYTIAKIKNDIQRKIHGTSLNKIQDIDGVINEAARDVLADVDPAETIRISQITNALYNKVFDYQLPSDLKGNKVIDIRPQVNRTLNDNFSQTYSEAFDLAKENNTFNIQYNSGVKSIRISKDLGSGNTISSLNGITNNGTWVVGNDATNLTEDGLNYITGGASLNFDLDGSTTDGYLENSTLESLDLSKYENKGALFLYVYLPDSSIITNVDLRWGNDSSNYWNATATSQQNSVSFQNGWNLLRFDWNGATEIGTGDSENVDYSRITINYNGTVDTDIRVDNLVIRLGSIYDIEYYSKFIFKSSAGTWKEEEDDDTDEINLDTDSYNLLLDKIMTIVAPQISGVDSGFDFEVAREKYQTNMVRYKGNNKSQIQKPKVHYYRIK